MAIEYKESFLDKMHKNANVVKIIIVLTVLIDVIGFGIVFPVLPYYVESFGASPFVVTLLFSVFAFFSFFSGPFLGSLSDRVGRRPILILSIVSTSLGWFVFALGNSLWVLFLGRIIDGVAAGNFPIAQSYLVDISKTDKERTANLGLIGAMWGVGFIIGPALGAMLSGISTSLPFFFVGGLASLNAIGAYFFLPETHHQRDLNKKIPLNPFLPLSKAFKDKILISRYAAWLLFGIAFAIMNSIFALYVKEVFEYSATVAGYIFTGMGILLVINQMLLLKTIWLKKFNEKDLEVWFFLLMAFGFLLADFKSFILFSIGFFFVTIAQSTLRVVISSGVVSVAGNMRRGEVLGIMSSILSVSMVLGPVIGGILFETNVSYPFLMNVVLLLVAFVIMKKSSRSIKVKEYESGIKVAG